jgi:hypothetical protein
MRCSCRRNPGFTRCFMSPNSAKLSFQVPLQPRLCLPSLTPLPSLSSCSDIAGAALPLVAASKSRCNGLHHPPRTSPGKTDSTSSSVSRPLRLGDKPKRKKEGMSGAHLTAATSTRTWASQRLKSGPSESSSPTGATSARTGSSEASTTAWYKRRRRPLRRSSSGSRKNWRRQEFVSL